MVVVKVLPVSWRNLCPEEDEEGVWAHGSAIISPMMLVNTSSHNASVVGSYAGVHWMYAPGMLVTYYPVLMGLTLA